MTNAYITTRPVPAAMIGAIEGYLPSYARSITCLHGDMDTDFVRYRAHHSEIKYIRAAINCAKAWAAFDAMQAARRA